MAYRMIVLDLDGTLTNRDKVITPRTKEALLKLKSQGGTIVLASGRPTYGIMPLARELGLTEDGGYILSFNGGRVIESRTGEAVFAKEVPVASHKKITALAKEHSVHLLTC